MLAKQTMTSDIKREQRHMTLEIQVMAWDRYIKTDDDRHTKTDDDRHTKTDDDRRTKTDDDRHTKTDDDKCLLEFNCM